MIYAGDFRKGMTFEIDGDSACSSGLPARKAGQGRSVRKDKAQEHPDRRYQGRILQPGRQVPESTHRDKDDAVPYTTTASSTTSWTEKLSRSGSS